MRKLVLAAALSLPMIAPLGAYAAGGDSWSPPKPTETTKTCKGKRVWDETKKRCVRPKQSSLNQQELLQAVRELAYADRQEDAQAVLAALPEQDSPMALTYWVSPIANLAIMLWPRAIISAPLHLTQTICSHDPIWGKALLKRAIWSRAGAVERNSRPRRNWFLGRGFPAQGSRNRCDIQLLSFSISLRLKV